MYNQKRREFFRNVAFLVPALAVMPSSLFSKNVRNVLRTGVIGTGIWGREYLSAALTLKDLTITAICDSDKASLQEGLQLFKGSDRPHVFDSWQQMLESDVVDVVIIATPAHTHYAIAKAAMLAGKHVACGPVMGETLEEHRDIVKISQQTGRHYFTLDEQSYRWDLQAVSRMDFGELHTIYAGAPYDVLPPQVDTYPLYPSLFLQRLLGDDNQIETIAATTKEVNYVVRKVSPKTGNHKLLLNKGVIPFICLTTTKGQQVYLQTEKGYTTGTYLQGTASSWIDYTRLMRIGDKHWEEDQIEQPATMTSPFATALTELLLTLKSSDPRPSVRSAATNSLIALLGRQSASQGGRVYSFSDCHLI
ncbi:Gfo/Idh/MocA family protein [Chitinophaga sancti]|uniref:Gfo/Idh/MocA family oxidoreductase n=1 Tax=Chitinophaga sancti TaxID=1004 RepID=A0A1K1QNG2_9BACT|nr:Gfo/Idh/MocA family oxidoreductase [Chitinophaga sancti]WQD65092.1 Gfo/Idh/MocA family oxidoreductase [Chitinophaga sancti]WQG89284.1 Gfo/Idh/MocA family oxidoreductase [Chitinophaga sancti]SFW61171.1 Oxidoreductase family, NAD-binding Rossmann fold [Chitinophaga sancti]